MVNTVYSLIEFEAFCKHGKILEDVMTAFLDQVSDDDKAKAFEMLLRERPNEAKRMVVSWARMRPGDGKLVSCVLARQAPFARRPIRSVAFLIGNLHFGGGPRSTSKVANMLARATTENGAPRFKVTVVTDEEASPRDYALDANVARHVLPSWNRRNGADGHFDALWEFLDRERPDLVIQGTWRGMDAVWDMLLCRVHPLRPAFIHHFRTNFASLYENSIRTLENSRLLYEPADALVVLGKMDGVCWSAYNPKTYVIENPAGFDPHPPQKAHEKPAVLWLGRLNDEHKQTLEFVKIAELVSEQVPDARFDIVGDGNRNYMDKVRKAIRDAHMEDRLFVHGHRNDVQSFYEAASVFCCTSKFEGFCLTLYEAASHAVPIVMYDLPWIDVQEHLPSVRTCAQLDAQGAADNIAELLRNKALHEDASRRIAEEYAQFKQIDVVGKWLQLIHDLEEGIVPERQAPLREDMRRILDEINRFSANTVRRNQMLHGRNKKLHEQLVGRGE